MNLIDEIDSLLEGDDLELGEMTAVDRHDFLSMVSSHQGVKALRRGQGHLIKMWGKPVARLDHSMEVLDIVMDLENASSDMFSFVDELKDAAPDFGIKIKG